MSDDSPLVGAREALDDFLLGLPGLRERNTIHYYRSALRQLVGWLEAQALILQDLRIVHMRRYLAWREAQGISQTTRYHDATAARVWLEYCRTAGYIAANPMAGVRVRKPPPRVEFVPTAEQVKVLLAAVRARWKPATNPNARYTGQRERTYFERRDYAVVLLIVESGCRLGEACGVRLADVDYAARTVTFRQTKTDRDRVVPVSEQWLLAVRQYLTVRPKCQATCLFVGQYGEPLTGHWFCHKFPAYLTYAGLPRQMTAQSLRRYRLSEIADDNVMIASVIGGNSIKVIRDHYYKQRPEVVRAVWERSQTLVNKRSVEAKRRKLI